MPKTKSELLAEALREAGETVLVFKCGAPSFSAAKFPRDPYVEYGQALGRAERSSAPLILDELAEVDWGKLKREFLKREFLDVDDAPECDCGRYHNGLDCMGGCARLTWIEDHECPTCHQLPSYCICPI